MEVNRGTQFSSRNGSSSNCLFESVGVENITSPSSSNISKKCISSGGKVGKGTIIVALLPMKYVPGIIVPE